jgi:hypothetical protein
MLEVQEEANRIDHIPNNTSATSSPSSPSMSSRFTLRKQNSGSEVVSSKSLGQEYEV